MIKVFYGEDRGKALLAAERFLGGKGYEVVEGAELSREDLPSLFRGASLFEAGERKILLRDVISSEVGGEIARYADGGNRVAILELSADKRAEGWKNLAAAGIEMAEFKGVEDRWAVFDVYKIAKRDAVRAVSELRRLEPGLEPKAFIGVLAAGVFRDFEDAARRGGGAKERRVLRELAKLDMDLGKVLVENASAERPWLLIESFLARLQML